MRARFVFVLLCGAGAAFSSCQISRNVLQGPSSFGKTLSASASDTATTVIMMHDSQGPQATRVTLTTAEAATFRQQ
ncbi:hypothetical protein [Hymenobacter seoulensis]